MRISAWVIHEGERMAPRHYGVAYFDPSSFTFVCYPFPLNYVARVGHFVVGRWDCLRSQLSRYDLAWMERLGSERTKSYERGYKHGEEAVWRKLEILQEASAALVGEAQERTGETTVFPRLQAALANLNELKGTVK